MLHEAPEFLAGTEMTIFYDGRKQGANYVFLFFSSELRGFK